MKKKRAAKRGTKIRAENNEAQRPASLVSYETTGLPTQSRPRHLAAYLALSCALSRSIGDTLLEPHPLTPPSHVLLAI